MDLKIKASTTLVLLLLAGCALETKRQDKKTAQTPEEISLKQDRSDLDKIRADIPADLRESNDEWALILKDMDGSKTPAEVRSRFYEKTRRIREKFSNTMKKSREDFNKNEQRDRKEFLSQLDSERKDFDPKSTPDKKKSFWEDQSDRRKIFFESQRDKRKDFESEMNQKRRDFDEHIKDKQKQFDDAIREYTKNFESKIKEKKQLESARDEVRKSFHTDTSPEYPGRDSDLKYMNTVPALKGQTLAPEEE